MKNSILSFLLPVLVLLLSTSCKSEFERIRTSGDSAKIFEQANGYYENGEYYKAQTLYELIIGSYRGKKEAEDIYYKYAYCHYYQKKYILASYYFKNFTNTFTNSKYREEADFMSAYSNFKLSPSFRLDQSYTARAVEGMQLFVNTYPNSERVADCNRLIDEMRAKMEEKAYDEGQLYFKVRQYQAATHSFENLLKDYPDTKNAEEVRYMMVKASYLLANNSISIKQEERFNTTIEYYNRFKRKYEKSQYIKELDNINKNSINKLKEITNDRYKIKGSRT